MLTKQFNIALRYFSWLAYLHLEQCSDEVDIMMDRIHRMSNDIPKPLYRIQGGSRHISFPGLMALGLAINSSVCACTFVFPFEPHSSGIWLSHDFPLTISLTVSRDLIIVFLPIPEILCDCLFTCQYLLVCTESVVELIDSMVVIMDALIVVAVRTERDFRRLSRCTTRLITGLIFGGVPRNSSNVLAMYQTVLRPRQR